MFEWRRLEPTGETLLLLSEPLAVSPVLALFCPLQNLKKKNLQGFKQSQLAGGKKNKNPLLLSDLGFPVVFRRSQRR